MKTVVIRILLVFFSICLYLCLSCSKVFTDADFLSNQNGNAKVKISSLVKSGLFIESIDSKTDKYVISISDGGSFWVKKDGLSIVTIGIDGYWYVNDKKSSFSTEVFSGKDVLSNGIDRGFVTGDLIGIVEGYTDWTFYLVNNDPIVLVKSLYSYDPDSIIRGVNHRGYSSIAPENTLPAYRMSRLKGFKYVETDVRFTSDGIPVLLHDQTVDRTSNGIGAINEISYSDVRTLDFGSWKADGFKGTRIPTLEEFLDLCRRIGLEPNIELKEGNKEQISGIVKAISKYGLKGKSTYISFSAKLLQYVLEEDPTARIGFLCNKVASGEISTAISLKKPENEVYIGASDYGESSISSCNAAQIPLSVWVINSEKEIRALPKYVSGVSSDFLHAGRVLYKVSK